MWRAKGAPRPSQLAQGVTGHAGLFKRRAHPCGVCGRPVVASGCGQSEGCGNGGRTWCRGASARRAGFVRPRGHPLPQGWTPISAIVLVKCLDEDGEPTWAFRTTDGLNDEELLGTLTVRTDLLRRELVDSYYDGDD